MNPHSSLAILWKFVQFPVTAGKHTFIWSYDKDDSYGGGKDSAWIDGVTLPPTTQEIALSNEGGEDLLDGKSSAVFPSVGVGYSSSTLRIKRGGGRYCK